MRSSNRSVPDWCAFDATLTTRAGALAVSFGSSRRVSRKEAMWFTANVVSSPSSVRARSPMISPALLTSTSTRGSAVASSAASMRTARCDARSATKSATSELWLRCLISVTARSPVSCVRHTTATVAPARASASAVSLPIPELAPVTMQVFPLMGVLDCTTIGDSGHGQARRGPGSPGANLGQQPLGGGPMARDPVGLVARLPLVDHLLELLSRLVVAALLDETPGQLDAGARGDVPTALVTRQLRLGRGRPVVGPREMYPGQEEERLQRRCLRHLALEQVARPIEPGSIFMKGAEEPPRLQDRAAGRRCDGRGARQREREDGGHRREDSGATDHRRRTRTVSTL